MQKAIEATEMIVFLIFRAAADLVARQTLGLQSGRESTSSIGSEPPAAKKAKIETADSNGNTTSAALHNANSGNRHSGEKTSQGHMKISAKKAGEDIERFYK